MPRMRPAWNGQGIDPWLPQRLRARAQIAAAERTVYDSYFARLSGWLVQVARAVVRGSRVDPYGVYSAAPAWADSMAEFTDTTITSVMGRAYAQTLGEGYRFDSRPGVARHLAGVRNRMARMPDEVFDLIASEVSEAANEGESIPETAERIEDVLDATDTERWPNRAVVTARTETMGALNAGRMDSWAALADILDDDDEPVAFESMWLATEDDRTRPTHRAADGQRVPQGTPFMVGGFALAFPGDPDGPPHEVIQCRCTTLLMEVGEEIDLSGRQFRTM